MRGYKNKILKSTLSKAFLKTKTNKILSLFHFILIFLIVSIKVSAVSVTSSLPQLDFSLTQSSDYSGYTDTSSQNRVPQPLPLLPISTPPPQTTEPPASAQLPSSEEIQNIPPVDQLIQKPIEELVSIYLDTSDSTQINDWLQDWNNRNIQIYGDKWNLIPELDKKTELAYYIHLKPMVQDLYPDLTAQQDIDTKVAQFASLIKGGLENKEKYTLKDFLTLYKLLQGETISPQWGLELIDEDKILKDSIKNWDMSGGTIRGDITDINPRVSLPFKEAFDFSEAENLSFNLDFELVTWEGLSPTKVVITFYDTRGERAVVEREVSTESREDEDGNIVLSLSRPVLITVSPDEVKEKNPDIDLKTIQKVKIEIRSPEDETVERGWFTIADFKFNSREGIFLPGAENLSDEVRANFLDFISGSEADDLPPIIQNINYPQITSDFLKLWEPLFNPDNLELLKPKIINLILNYINETENKNLSISDNWFEVFGILGAIGRVAKESGLKINDSSDLEVVLEVAKAKLNNFEYPSQGVLTNLDEFYYPCPVKIWYKSERFDTRQGIILQKVDKERAFDKLEELKSQGTITEKEMELAKLKTGLDSTLFRKLDFKKSIIDKLIFFYWKNYLKKHHISADEFNQLLDLYETLTRHPLEFSKFSFDFSFDLKYLAPDMIFGLKRLHEKSNLYGGKATGMYNQEFRTISLTVPLVTAHELTHHRDLWTFSPLPTYVVPSERYADISRIFYDVYESQKYPIFEIEEEDEAPAYAFSDFYYGKYFTGIGTEIQRKILSLMLQFVYGYTSGYGSYYFHKSYKLPLSFKEVRKELEANPDLPEFYREALDLTEMIFYNWRRQAGFKDNCELLERYDNLSYEELKEKIKQDFPHFYPEAVAFGVDFIRRMKKESSFPEILQGLSQAEFALKNSFSSLPTIFDLLNRDIPDLVKIALIGELGKKVKLAFQSCNMLEDASTYIYISTSHLKNFYLENADRIITQLIDFSYRHKDELTGKFTFALLYDLSQAELFPQNFRQDIAQLCQIYEGIKQKLDTADLTPVEVIPRFNPVTEVRDELPVYQRPLFFCNETTKFLSRSENNKSDTRAREIIFSWWENLSGRKEFLNALINNGWEQFLTELNNFIMRDSFKVYKHLTGKEILSIPDQLNLPAINAFALPFSPREMKMMLMELDKRGDTLLRSFDARYNNGGSLYGAWNAFPEDYSQYCKENPSYISLGNIGSSLRLDYDVESDNPQGAYNGFWMRIPERDLSRYQALVFFIKGDEIAGYPYRFKISLEDKEWQKVDYWPGEEEVTVGRGDLYIEGIDDDWKMVVIPLEKFLENGNLKDLTSIDVLSITFEKDIVGQNTGTIYIDEIGFIKDLSLLLKNSPAI